MHFLCVLSPIHSRRSLRPLHLGRPMLDVLELEEQLVGMPIASMVSR